MRFIISYWLRLAINKKSYFFYTHLYVSILIKIKIRYYKTSLIKNIALNRFSLAMVLYWFYILTITGCFIIPALHRSVQTKSIMVLKTAYALQVVILLRRVLLSQINFRKTCFLFLKQYSVGKGVFGVSFSSSATGKTALALTIQPWVIAKFLITHHKLYIFYRIAKKTKRKS